MSAAAVQNAIHSLEFMCTVVYFPCTACTGPRGFFLSFLFVFCLFVCLFQNGTFKQLSEFLNGLSEAARLERISEHTYHEGTGILSMKSSRARFTGF